MAKGFRKYRQGSSNYIMRIPEGWTPDASDTESTQPLMFIHGLGMGMAQYASLLTYIAKAEVLKERPVIIPIQPHISMSFFEKDYLRPPERVQTTKALVEIAEVS
jgi:pimeloyl-ACP methyl ester carboxylesterase